MNKSAVLSGYYQHGYGGRSASETLTVTSVSETRAEGDYIYKDSNPRKGPTGATGVWTGKWTLSVDGGKVKLTRTDTASGWHGAYTCKKR